MFREAGLCCYEFPSSYCFPGSHRSGGLRCPFGGLTVSLVTSSISLLTHSLFSDYYLASMYLCVSQLFLKLIYIFYTIVVRENTCSDFILFKFIVTRFVA